MDIPVSVRWAARGGARALLGSALFAAMLAAPGAVADQRFGEYLAARLAGATGDLANAAAYYEQVLAVDSDNPSLLFVAALFFLPDGQVDRAVELSERLIANAEDPDMISTAGLIAAVGAAKRGDWDAATEFTRRVPPNGLNRLLNPMTEAWTLVGGGDVVAGLAALEALANNAQYEPFLHYHRALIHQFSGNTEAAEASYRDALAAGAGARQIEAFGRLLERQQRGDEALSLYRRYLEAQPDNRVVAAALERATAGGEAHPFLSAAADGLAEVFHGVAASLTQENSNNPARNFANLAVYLREGFGAALVVLANTRESEEAYERANDALRQVPRNSPYSWDARKQIALNLSRLAAVDEAVELLGAMAEERPDETDALVLLGDVLRTDQRWSEAAEAYSRAIDRVDMMQPGHWMLLYTRGTTYERSGEWDKAEGDFLDALDLQPDQPFVLNYLGYSWIEMGIRVEEATEMIARAVQQQPTAGFIIDSLGWGYYKLGNFEEAARALERAVQLTPGDPTINDHLGDAYWYAGRRREAVFQWRRALDLGPEPELIAVIESKLANGLPD